MIKIVSRFIFVCLIVSGLSFFVTACSHQESANQIRIGTISGPETELMQVAQKVAKEKYGLDVDIVEFDNYSLPNQALYDGSIDINMFQTIPFLNADSEAHGYNFTIVGKAYIYPMALYSTKVKSIRDVPTHSIVAIPNDPSNEGRALLLLQKAGLIKLDPQAKDLAIPEDITDNPKALVIKELDAAQLTRTLPDVTIAVINSNYALAAGLSPKNSLFSEGKNSLFVNVFVVKSEFEHDARVTKLIAAFQSPEVQAKAKQLFKGEAIPAW